MEKSVEQSKSVPMTLIEFEQCCKISLSLQQSASMQSRKDFPKFGLPRYRCNATNTAHVYRSGIMPYTKVVPVQRVLPARMVSDGDHRSSRREDRPGTACTVYRIRYCAAIWGSHRRRAWPAGKNGSNAPSTQKHRANRAGLRLPLGQRHSRPMKTEKRND